MGEFAEVAARLPLQPLGSPPLPAICASAACGSEYGSAGQALMASDRTQCCQADP
jgi:hypothetical protein